MKKFNIFLAALLLCMCAAAQEKEVRGIVICQENGEPLAGAAVGLKNSAWATITDVNGRFSIRVPVGEHKLQVHFMGMQTRTITLSKRNEDEELLIKMEREERKVTPFVHAGVTLSRPKGDGTDGPDIGFAVGAGASYALTHLFSLAASVNIIQKPSEWKGTRDGTYYTCDINPLYLNIPIVVEMKLWDRSNRNKFIVNLGPYIGIGLGGEYRYVGSLSDNGNERGERKGDLFTGTDGEVPALKRFEAGLQIGVGYELRHFYLGLDCQYAFTPLLNNDFKTAIIPSDGVRNFCADISLGYRF